MYDPDRHYLVVTKRLTAMLREGGADFEDGARAIRHVIPALAGAQEWRPVRCDTGEGYAVPVTIRGRPFVLRVVFTPNAAPDGVKTVVYATHAHPPKDVPG